MSLISQPTPKYEYSKIIIPDYQALSIIPPETTELIQPQTISVSLVEAATVTVAEPTYALPLNWDTIDPDAWSKPHHDYPALDVRTAPGSPVFAIREGSVVTATRNDGGACGGTVIMNTDIGRIIYCHLSQVVIQSGWITTGQYIGNSGGVPGNYGAGSSTVAHLHVGITRNSRTVCIQPLLVSIINYQEPDLTNTTRCSN